MNMVVWWFVVMILSWLITAWVLWKTTMVVSGEEGASDEEGASKEEGGVENG